eukprot:gene30034-17929_t
MTALAAISYLFFRQANGTTFVMAYGQAIIDPDGTTCRVVLALPNMKPKEVVLADLMDPEDHSLGNDVSAQYGAAVARSIGYFTQDQYQAKRHGEVAPLYANLEELMLRARDVPTPGVLFDVMHMEGTSLTRQHARGTAAAAAPTRPRQPSPAPRAEAHQPATHAPRTPHPGPHTGAPRATQTPKAARTTRPAPPPQGCELGALITPALQEKDIEIYIQNSVVDRFSKEPWCRPLMQTDVVKADVLTIPSPSFGDIQIQILLWPRPSRFQLRGRGARDALPLDESGEPVIVDDEVVPGMRLFQSSDRAVWVEEGKIPTAYRHRSSFGWSAATTGGKTAHDYRYFLKLCGLKNEQGAVAAGLPSEDEFSDIRGYEEKDVKYWLMLNNVLTYVMLDRKMLHRLKLLKDTKDDLHDNDMSHELFHLIYRGIAKRIWEEKDRIRESNRRPPTASASATASQATGTQPQVLPAPARVSLRGNQSVKPALGLGSVPVEIPRDNRKRKTPERLTYTVRQKVVPSPRACAIQKQRHKQQSQRSQTEPSRQAAIKLLEQCAEQTHKLKRMLADQVGLTLVGKKNEEVLQLAKSAHELVSKMAQG